MNTTTLLTGDGVPFQEGMLLWRCKWRQVDDDPEQYQSEVECIGPATFYAPDAVKIGTKSFGEVLLCSISQLYSTEAAAVRAMIAWLEQELEELNEVRDGWVERLQELEGPA